MRYISTRGKAKPLGFDDVILEGLASDKGLYVPEEFPIFSPEKIRSFQNKSYQEIAYEVIAPFIGGSIVEPDLKELIDDVYARFNHPEIAPLTKLDALQDDFYLLELYHGTTLAFKDYAMQLVGALFDKVLGAQNKKVTIVGATSGDTGSAAIEAFRGKDAANVFIIHPKGGVSDVQRHQMTTVQDANIHNIALEGTFDDCQNLLRDLFIDTDFREKTSLSAVNSINWARILGQIVYYFVVGAKLGAPDKPFSVTVPCGNCGNIYAGWIARKMGLPIKQMVIGSNENDILTRFIKSGEMKLGTVAKTISPSIDIQISNNVERLLFDYCDRDAESIDQMMQDLRDKNVQGFKIAEEKLQALRELFQAAAADENATLETIKTVYEKTGELIDTHSAVAIYAALEKRKHFDHPMVVLGTAHPAKFPDAVKRATGVYPQLPDFLSDLMEREEKYDVLPHDLETVKKYILQKIGA
ncbi:MAG: threonine synthase [Alphaproteobacteria bacterium]